MDLSTAETTPLLDLRSLMLVTAVSIFLVCGIDIAQSLTVWSIIHHTPLWGGSSATLNSVWCCCCTPLLSVPIGVAYTRLAVRRGHRSLGGGALGSALAGGITYMLMASLNKVLNTWVYAHFFPNALKSAYGLIIATQRANPGGLVFAVVLWTGFAAGAAALAGLCVAALDQQRRQRELNQPAYRA